MGNWRTFTIRNALQILVILLLLVAAGLLEWLSMNQSSQLNQVTQNYNNTQLQLLTVQGQLAKLSKETASNSSQSSSTTNLLAKQLPSSIGITDSLVQVTKVAVADHVNMQSFTFSNTNVTPSATAKPSSSATSGTLTLSSLPYVTVTLSVTGTPSQIQKFITDLEHQRQLTSVQSFSLNNGTSGSASTSISLWMYYQ